MLQSGSSLFSFSQYKVEFPWDRVEKALRLKIYYIGSLSLVWNIDSFECMLYIYIYACNSTFSVLSLVLSLVLLLVYCRVSSFLLMIRTGL